ncbi:MAG: hypothetical protein M3Y07_19290 [Acidobacteriota bacterium]|nr:hypothetical protein [Acidobacteriota bacterium]
MVKRAHLAGEYFTLEKDGVPVAGILSADELEDYLELQDPQVRRAIAESNADIKEGRTRPATDLLTDFKRWLSERDQLSRVRNEIRGFFCSGNRPV